MNPKGRAHGNDQGNHDQDRGEDVHQAAGDQKSEVQQDQEDILRADVLLHPAAQAHRHFRVHDVVGQPLGRSQYDQNPTDDGDALEHNRGEVFERNIPVDEHLDDQGVDHGHGAGFHQGGDPEKIAEEDDHGKQDLPE